MTQQDDLLIELLTEELPPKTLLKLAQAFEFGIKEGLQKAGLEFESTHFFATPRRLAVKIKNVTSETREQVIERKGPALSAAYDKEGNPTPACMGFAKSCGVNPAELKKIKTPQGEWVACSQKVPGKSIQELIPGIVEQAAMNLPIVKRMRWGDSNILFARPIQSVILLYGDQIVDAEVLGCRTGRVTRGHRFHAPDWITIPHADTYESLLETEGHVIADFIKRRTQIKEKAEKILQLDKIALDKALKATVKINEDLLNEVTGIVEWPEALLGFFDEKFLNVPKEVLISSMQDHQRYFPVEDVKGNLLRCFVVISNIQSHDPERVIQGNERVLRARLSDAAFFYETDQKISLEERLERLKGITFQAKLGTLYDKAQRISKIAEYIADKMDSNKKHAARAGLLAKTDLTSDMVNEFPELQGIMGGYYALHDHEAPDVAQAIREQYMPRFAGDTLPQTTIGQAVSLADKLDTLVGAFGINQIPTGDKDPYGLRRATLGVIRILIENKIDLDVKDILLFAAGSYAAAMANVGAVQQVLDFVQERLRAWYQDQGIAADVFASVATLGITNPLDAHERIKAVQSFKKLSAAETLSIANKRVSNILAKYVDAIEAKAIDPAMFENDAEQELARQLDLKSQAVTRLYQSGQYDQVLLQLADLRKPIDDFFDQVMVMTDDKARRENRLLLLTKLRALFLQVADIALLQQGTP